jgi:hypothetical protein
MNNALKIGLSLGVGALLLSGCNVYDDSLGQKNPIGGAGSAGTAGTAGTAGANNNPDGEPGDRFWLKKNDCPADEECGKEGDGCESAGMPTHEHRPPSEGVTEKSIDPFYFGLTQMRLGFVNDDEGFTKNPDAWKQIGFDVDGVCTSSETCTSVADTSKLISVRSCKKPEGAISQAVDGNQCLDNLVGNLFPVAAATPDLSTAFAFSEGHWNCGIRAGSFNVIGKVSNYNGELYDDQVRLDIYNSVGLDNPLFWCDEGDGGTLQDNWFNQAPWFGNNLEWQISRRSLKPLIAEDQHGTLLPDAKAADPAAYVRNGWLIAELPEGAEIWLNGMRSRAIPGIRLIIRRGVLAARLVKQPNETWEVEIGNIAGVIRNEDILAAFRDIGFCENMCSDYELLSTYLRNFSDTLSGTNELQPDIDCDAMSVGVEFKATQIVTSTKKIVDVDDPIDCPEPRASHMPRQGCTCTTDGCE